MRLSRASRAAPSAPIPEIPHTLRRRAQSWWFSPRKGIKVKRNIWTKDGGRVEVYRSSVSSGSRFSLGGKMTCYNIRPSCIGTNNFSSVADAEAALLRAGYIKTK